MQEWNQFHETYGPPTRYKAFEHRDRERLNEVIPDWLLKLWEMDGWAGYCGGLIWTIDPDEYAPLVESWSPPLLPCRPVARTAFGSLLMLHPYSEDEGEYDDNDDQGEESDDDEDAPLVVVEINPLTASFSMVGADAEFFLTDQMAQQSYARDAYWADKVTQACRDVGALEWNEMYGFEPALALGGSGSRETVRRVNMFEHHLLLSQLDELKYVKY